MTDIPEKAFQTQVLTLARWYAWRIQHTRPAQYRSGRWATPIQGHAGFPDLVLAHSTHGLIFAELKSARGKVSEAQTEWIKTLRATGAEVHIWRPADLQNIATRLSGKEI
jgi:hypothetical protein